MGFRVSDSTLVGLEWSQVAARLAAHLHTPVACAAFDPAGRGLFEEDPRQVRARLEETSEARGLLEASEIPPLGGGAEISAALSLLRRGGVLTPRELLDLRSTLAVLHDVTRFLRHRAEAAPRLHELLAGATDLRDLEEEITFAIDAEGEVRDSASDSLASSRREARALAGELTRRIEDMLRRPEITQCLSDTFYTLRNDRYVLPVRTDARRRVPGIVHDASSSGTTLFVEPESVVDLNNRLKQAELTAQREIRRVLRDLSESAAAALPEIESGLSCLQAVDRAFARGHLSREMEGVEPEVREDGVFRLPALRHPLIPGERVVANDVHLGESFHVLVLSGPNAGGKTVALKSIALAALFVRAGLHVPAGRGARVDLADGVLADIGDAQDLRESLSTFSAHIANLAEIVEQASSRSLVVLDEVGVGTDPGEGAALAQAVLETLADSQVRVVATTHYNLLKEMAALDERFENASFEFDPETLAPTYNLRFGAPGISSAAALAERMGLRESVVARARALLEGEDRQFDGLLAELASGRVALDRERAAAQRAAREAEATRDEYQQRLGELRQRRAELFERWRQDLEGRFREAHGRIAAVIRELQRAGTAQQAALARERLLAIRDEVDTSAEESGLAEVASPTEGEIDWSRMTPGDTVRVRGGREGTLLSVPDRQGRVAVRIGAARLVVPVDRLCEAREAAVPSGATRAAARISVSSESAEDRESAPPRGHRECDLRGLRVEEALEQVDAALDRAARRGSREVLFIHGHGTGAVREAVRSHLARSPYVRERRAGAPEEGGEGVTVALLEP
jgi:DNA mismatch repair protein MutS2